MQRCHCACHSRCDSAAMQTDTMLHREPLPPCNQIQAA